MTQVLVGPGSLHSVSIMSYSLRNTALIQWSGRLDKVHLLPTSFLSTTFTKRFSSLSQSQWTRLLIDPTHNYNLAGLGMWHYPDK